MAIEIWQATFEQPRVPDTTLLCQIEICDTNLPKLLRRQDLATARHDFFIAFHWEVGNIDFDFSLKLLHNRHKAKLITATQVFHADQF